MNAVVFTTLRGSHNKLIPSSLRGKSYIIHLFNGIASTFLFNIEKNLVTVENEEFKNLYARNASSTFYFELRAYHEKPSFEFYKKIETSFDFAFRDIPMTPDLQNIYVQNKKLIQALADHYSDFSINQIKSQKIYNQAIEVFKKIISIRNFESLKNKSRQPELFESDYLLFQRLYEAAKPVALADHDYINFINTTKELIKEYDDLFKNIYGDLSGFNKAFEKRQITHRKSIEDLELLINELEVELILS